MFAPGSLEVIFGHSALSRRAHPRLTTPMALVNSRIALLAAAISCVAITQASAQSHPYTLEDILAYVGGGVAAPTVIAKAKNSCITFKLTPSVVSKLRSEGANDALVGGLRSACYRGPAGIERPAPVPAPKPKPRDRVVTKYDTVVMPPTVRTDTVVVYRPVPRETAALTIYEHDLRTYRNVDIDSTASCKRSFELGAYTLSNTTGHFCSYEWPTKVGDARIEVDLVSHGNPNIEAGIRFGHASEPADSYIFYINELGQFALDRSRPGKWDFVIRFKNSALINVGANAANRLAVEVRGRDLAFFINGQLVANHQSDSVVSGTVGVGVFGLHSPSTVVLNSIRVTELR